MNTCSTYYDIGTSKFDNRLFLYLAKLRAWDHGEITEVVRLQNNNQDYYFWRALLIKPNSYHFCRILLRRLRGYLIELKYLCQLVILLTEGESNEIRSKFDVFVHD